MTNLANSGSNSGDLLHQLQNDHAARTAAKNAGLITISIRGADLIDCLQANSIPLCLIKTVSAFAVNWPLILHEIQKNIQSQAEIYVMTVYNPFRGDDPNYSLVEFFIQQINFVIKIFRFYYHYKVVDAHEVFQGKFSGSGQWKVCEWTHFCEVPRPSNLPDPHPTDIGHQEIARLHEAEYLNSHS